MKRQQFMVLVAITIFLSLPSFAANSIYTSLMNNPLWVSVLVDLVMVCSAFVIALGITDYMYKDE